jgi:hypothetical protein
MQRQVGLTRSWSLWLTWVDSVVVLPHRSGALAQEFAMLPYKLLWRALGRSHRLRTDLILSATVERVPGEASNDASRSSLGASSL